MKVLLLLFAFTGHYLLMQPIEVSIKTGDFSQFRDISKKKISIHCEPPFKLKGYLFIDKFIQDFSAKYSRYKAEKTEWSSKQFEDNFAVQSLNVILRNKSSGKEVFYKFIFFLKKNKEWQIYYLRGLRI